MSASNRSLKPGKYRVTYENRLQTFIGRLTCIFAGHKKATFELEGGNKEYCICCWKELSR